MKTVLTTAFCLGLFLRSVVAHELPLSIMYPGQSVIVAASFNLTGSEIEQAYNDNSQYFDYAAWAADNVSSSSDQRSNECDQITNARTCGQVDHFFRAATVAMLTCQSFAVIQKTQYSGKLVPRFTAPASFISGNSATVGHHSNYDLSQGIAFDCVYPAPLPPPPVNSDNGEVRGR